MALCWRERVVSVLRLECFIVCWAIVHDVVFVQLLTFLVILILHICIFLVIIGADTRRIVPGELNRSRFLQLFLVQLHGFTVALHR